MTAVAAPPTVEELGWVTVDEAGAAGVARRVAVDCAHRLGFSEQRAGEVAIVAAELASNLHRHADGGALSVRCLRRGETGGIELVAVDSGPGMRDLPFSSVDGHSTAGTLGIGLGAVRRLSDRAGGYSLPGRGTVLTAQLWPGERRGVAGAESRVAGLSRPITGEKVCGDRYAARATGDGGVLVLVADGLGHGSLAAAASAAVVDAFLGTALEAPGAIVEHVHRAVSHTRGAAVSVARLESGSVVFSGLGNVAGTIAFPDGERRGMVSMPGIVGHRARGAREFSYALPPEGIVVLHSDGVTDRWSLRDYPGLSRQEPLLVAATLLRDAGVRRDDQCVAVAAGGEVT